jgi:hypothetical protein
MSLGITPYHQLLGSGSTGSFPATGSNPVVFSSLPRVSIIMSCDRVLVGLPTGMLYRCGWVGERKIDERSGSSGPLAWLGVCANVLC